jgi:hypothetical protein
MQKPETEKRAEGLPLKILRTLEMELGIFITDHPKSVSRSPNQQFAILDENEVHTGDLLASGRYFTEDELRDKIKELFRR